MRLQRDTNPRRAAARTPFQKMGWMLRSVALVTALTAVLTACTSPSASSMWSYGPTLEPAASGSVAPSSPASAAPSASAVAPPASASAAPASPAASAGPTGSAGASGAPTGDATELTIGTRTGAELEFEPDEVSVPAGGQVSIVFENLSTLPHNLTFNEPINAATNTIVDPGASETIEFPAPAPGDYTFVCTLHPGMEGILTVEAG